MEAKRGQLRQFPWPLPLVQWIDRHQGAMLSRPAPILFQLLLMHCSLLGHQAERPPRNAPVEHPNRIDPNDGDGAAIVSMEVRRIMIVVVHRDNDPVEARDFRHASLYCPR